MLRRIHNGNDLRHGQERAARTRQTQAGQAVYYSEVRENKSSTVASQGLFGASDDSFM